MPLEIGLLTANEGCGVVLSLNWTPSLDATNPVRISRVFRARKCGLKALQARRQSLRFRPAGEARAKAVSGEGGEGATP